MAGEFHRHKHGEPLNHTTFPSLADYATAREAALQFIERTEPVRVFIGYPASAPKVLEVKDPTGSNLNMSAIVGYAVESGANISLVEVKPSTQWIDYKTAEFLEMLRCRPGVQLISFDIASNPNVEDIMKQFGDEAWEQAKQAAMLERFERAADEVELEAKNMGSEDEEDPLGYGQTPIFDSINPINPMQKIGEFLAAGRTEGSTAVSAQPAPVDQGRESAHDLVTADLAERKAFGLAKYGVALQAHNGRDTLQDLYEELLDATCYIRTLIEERKVR